MTLISSVDISHFVVRLGWNSSVMVSRDEGYLLSEGKEDIADRVFLEFVKSQCGIELIKIVNRQENYNSGDFRTDSGICIECKSQPIDPNKYRKNFAEVFEETQNPKHLSGFEDLRSILDFSETDLKKVQVHVGRENISTSLGKPSFLSVSIRSMANAHLTAYINPHDDVRHIYVYKREEILGYIRDAMRMGMVRGAGNSNVDTFGVFIPLAEYRWQRVKGIWCWRGEGPEKPLSDLMN